MVSKLLSILKNDNFFLFVLLFDIILSKSFCLVSVEVTFLTDDPKDTSSVLRNVDNHSRSVLRKSEPELNSESIVPKSNVLLIPVFNSIKNA